MNFRKPPVIEAWIEFKLDLTDESIEWDEDRAQKFVATFYPSFTHTEFLGGARVTVDAKTRKVTAKEFGFERVRAFTKDRDKCVQAGRDILIFNQIKKKEVPWPTYEKLEDDAVKALEHYLEFRGLSKLTGVVLHYRDIANMPKEQSGGMELEKYFKVHPEVPDESFGSISGFNITLQMLKACEDSNTILTIQGLPVTDISAKTLAFSMDWHIICLKEIVDISSARQWLARAHAGLEKIFIAAFTEEGLKQFEPVPEEE